MPRHELLIGADAFWARARADIAAARERVLVQAMTFEGDAAGLAVAEAIADSPATTRRVRVDSYTRVVINDRRIASRRSRRDAALQAEAASTTAMFARLEAAGAEVTWTEPIRLFARDYPFRNHRKLIVADEVAYLGGVNFSDHNFAWPDLMVRLERKDAADRLAADFPPPGAPPPAAWRAGLDGVDLLALDGRTNAEGFAPVLELIDDALAEIDLLSPYVTFPFIEALGRARARGVRVRVLTPRGNNKPLVRSYLLHAACRQGLDLLQTPGMSHVKAMLVDGRALVLGSSNLDFVSYHAEAEVLAVFDDPALIADFRTRVLRPALDLAVMDAEPISVVAGTAAAAALRLAEGHVRLMRLWRGGQP